MSITTDNDQPARERLQLWQAACRGEITTAELYTALKQMRRAYGEAVYFRRPTQR